MHETEINNRVLILLLSSICLIVLPHAWHIPLPLFSFFSLLLGWRYLAIWKPNWLPNKNMVFLITLLGILLLMSQHQGILGRDAGTGLFVTALGLKLLEIKDKNDLYLISYLAFFVAATQFLYLQNIYMAVYILMISCLLIATLISINSQKPNTAASLKLATSIIIQAIPIAVVIFFIFPRLEAPQWMLFTDKNSGLTGLSDTLEPGSISRLGLSGELAFRVKFDGKIPHPTKRYWRGPVFSKTDGKRWTAINSNEFRLPSAKPEFFGTAYNYKITLEAQSHNWVYALDMPAKYPSNLRQNADYQVISRSELIDRSEYKLTSFTSYKIPYITNSEKKQNLQLPAPPSERVNTLVKNLHGFTGNPELFIQQTLNLFRKNNFYYTLNPPLYPHKPIETFLFESRYGFCSHYATAFVYLMRVGGIPARVVTGYQGGELNNVGNFLEIRQANAHAWTEVWLGKRGWTRVDPTTAVSPERIEQDVNIDLQIASGEISFLPVNIIGDVSWLKKARFFWNDLDYRWQRWVINYNSDNRTTFLSALGINDIRSIVIWLIITIGIFISILAFFLFRRQHKKADKASIIYKKYCTKLAKKQLTIGTSEGANDYAVRAKARFPDQAKNITDITNLYIRIRYGKYSDILDLQQFEKKVVLFQV